MRILMIGDVVGRPGRRAVEQLLPGLRHKYELDLVIANGENAAHGLGITLDTAQELLNFGVNVITSGNHIWAKKEIIPYLNGELPIVRPLNFPPGAPGRGFLSTGNALIVNLVGRVFMGEFDCPFRAMDSLLSEIEAEPNVIIVDFHAEATSEKVAMGRYLDGRVSAVLGTHTHVGTVDTCILPGGTAYVSDVGMVGPTDSVIGADADAVIHSFLTKMPHRLSVGKGRTIFDAVLVEVDEASGKALNIRRIRQEGEQ
ncbi:MAG: TIGR00282 family metallophosphoesterase [Dehalococcoidia bacterium]|nr:TIGR00282 family metallophosphoesterase [Dehalococcoidia bacterium]